MFSDVVRITELPPPTSLSPDSVNIYERTRSVSANDKFITFNGINFNGKKLNETKKMKCTYVARKYFSLQVQERVERLNM